MEYQEHKELIDSKKYDEFYIQALLLAEVVKRILLSKGNIQLTSKPSLEKKPVTEFVKRMRASGLSKFEERTYIGTVNFYRNAADQNLNKAVGVIVVYIPESQIVYLLNDIGYPVDNEEDTMALEDACGSFCNVVAGNFKSGLAQLGYKELEMSHFSSYQNDVVDGVDYAVEQPNIYEITFERRGVVKLKADINMGQLPMIGE